MSQENIDVVRAGYAAVQRGLAKRDVASFVRRFYEPEGEYDPIEEAEPLRGHDEIIDYFRRWLGVWDEFQLELEDVIDAGSHVVSVARHGGRARTSGIEISQRIYSVMEVRDGKVHRNREFLDRREALEAAGLSG